MPHLLSPNGRRIATACGSILAPYALPATNHCSAAQGAFYHGVRGWAGVDALYAAANREVASLLRAHGVRPHGVFDESAMSAARAHTYQEQHAGDGLHWYVNQKRPGAETGAFMASVANLLVAAAGDESDAPTEDSMRCEPTCAAHRRVP